MEEIQHRRAPARPRIISEIKIGDERVKIVGLVVDKRDTEFTLDDGSGRLIVVFDDPALAETVDMGAKVRVIGTPLSVAGTNELYAEISQRVDGLDLNLYSEVRREAEKLEHELR